MEVVAEVSMQSLLRAILSMNFMKKYHWFSIEANITRFTAEFEDLKVVLPNSATPITKVEICFKRNQYIILWFDEELNYSKLLKDLRILINECVDYD